MTPTPPVPDFLGENIVTIDSGYKTYGCVDIEKELERKVISALRSMFFINQKFKYNNEDSATRLIISPEYPNKTAADKTPHLIMSDISFSYNCSNSLGQNLYQDLYDPVTKKISGKTYANVIPFSFNLVCLAERYLSRDLANFVVNYLGIAFKDIMYSIGVNIMNISKSPTRATKQYSEKIFETDVSIQGHLEWVANIMYDDMTKEAILDQINVYLNM